jgi:hypothetical protein
MMLDRCAREKPFILIIAAPSIVEARKIALDAGISMPSAAVRHVRNAYGFRGWSMGTPVLTGGRDHWPAEFENCLMAQVARGQLRIAQDDDITRARESV